MLVNRLREVSHDLPHVGSRHLLTRGYGGFRLIRNTAIPQTPAPHVRQSLRDLRPEVLVVSSNLDLNGMTVDYRNHVYSAVSAARIEPSIDDLRRGPNFEDFLSELVLLTPGHLINDPYAGEVTDRAEAASVSTQLLDDRSGVLDAAGERLHLEQLDQRFLNHCHGGGSVSQ